jgi:hypothetical protein
LDWLEIIGLICLGVAILILIGRYPAKKRDPGWFLTEEGLQYVRSSGEQTGIAWNQVQKMNWTSYMGLSVVWREPEKSAGKALLGVGEAEAKELISIWERNKSPQTKQ